MILSFIHYKFCNFLFYIQCERKEKCDMLHTKLHNQVKNKAPGNQNVLLEFINRLSAFSYSPIMLLNI